jgi:outer membrane lipoprotein-sorting protein
MVEKLANIKLYRTERKKEGRKINRTSEKCVTLSRKPTYIQWNYQREGKRRGPEKKSKNTSKINGSLHIQGVQ